jgi:hypothetical protein
MFSWRPSGYGTSVHEALRNLADMLLQSGVWTRSQTRTIHGAICASSSCNPELARTLVLPLSGECRNRRLSCSWNLALAGHDRDRLRITERAINHPDQRCLLLAEFQAPSQNVKLIFRISATVT